MILFFQASEVYLSVGCFLFCFSLLNRRFGKLLPLSQLLEQLGFFEFSFKSLQGSFYTLPFLDNGF